MPVYPGKSSKSKKSVDYLLEKELAKAKRPRAGYMSVARTRGPLSFGEMKYFDTERTATSIPAVATDWAGTEFPPNVGTPTTLCVPVQGSAINQRIGRKIKLHKIRVHGIVSFNAQADQSTADTGAFVRIIMVHDKQTNGTQAQGEEIMAGASVAFNQPNSFQSLASLGRFKILKDEKLCIDVPNISYDGTNVEQAGGVRNFDFSVVFKKPLEISFNATNGGTISDIVDHSFCLYAITHSTSLAPQISYVARAYYKE